MTTAGARATRWGVRAREPREIRIIALMAALLFLTNAVANRVMLVVLDVNFELAHRNLYDWVAPVLAVAGLTSLLAFVFSEEALERVYPPTVLVMFAIGVVGTLTFMHAVGYPLSGFQAITYAIIAMLAFYLLGTWVAVTVVVSIVVGHAFLEYVTPATPWPVWMTTGYVAIVLLVAGSVTGWLMEQLARSRDAERTTAAELAELNANLEAKVVEQVGEVERLGRLRRFLSAPVAEAVLTSQDEASLRPHRREIAVLFCDLRGFTAFTKQVEPEEVMEVLDAYYAAAGEQITVFGATLGSFEGDGLMAYLNDPIPCDEPAVRVIELGMAIASAVDRLTPAWERRGYDLSYGVGMALGHATLGIVGYDGRSDYTALGTVVNLGARLCGVAKARQLIVDHRVFLQAEGSFAFTELEPVPLKGFGEPVPNYLVDRA